MPHRTPVLRALALFALSLWLAAGSPATAAADGLEDARSRGRLLVGVKTDFPPFGAKDPQGKIQGFDVDVARYLAKAMFGEDDRVELVEVTSGSRIPFLYSNRVDLVIATTTMTEERRRVLDFSEPYFISGSLLLVRSDSPIQALADIAGKRVGVLEGSIQYADLQVVAPGALLSVFETVQAAVSALEDGEIDAFCQDDVLVVALALDSPELKAVGKPFLPRPYGIAVRKGEAAFARWISSQLETMRESGDYGRLWHHYFGKMQDHLLIP